ncbi:MAG: hypothetical protein WAW96_20405, partial [Alphaproteobacteria bacterium]
MRDLKISRPELIGIICGFAAAATLTGAIMIFNVWPALTTPPLVIETPTPHGAAPAPMTPLPRGAANYPSTAKTTSDVTLPAPMPAALPSSIPAAPAPALTVPSPAP